MENGNGQTAALSTDTVTPQNPPSPKSKAKTKTTKPAKKATPQKTLTSDEKRIANRKMAEEADKVDARFLRGLEERLEISINQLCASLQISNPTFFKYRLAGVCPIYIRERASKLLKAKKLEPIPETEPIPQVKAKAMLRASKDAAEQKHAQKKAFVPSGFLDGIEERLGISTERLGELIGATYYKIKKWRDTGLAPVAIRAAINGLMAEKKQLNAAASPKSIADFNTRQLPARRQTPSADNKIPRYAKRDAVELHRVPERENILVSVPKDQVRVACATFAALGFRYTTQSED